MLLVCRLHFRTYWIQEKVHAVLNTFALSEESWLFPFDAHLQGSIGFSVPNLLPLVGARRMVTFLLVSVRHYATDRATLRLSIAVLEF